MWPDGRIAGGPFTSRHEAAPEANRIHGYVQFEAGESASAADPANDPHDDAKVLGALRAETAAQPRGHLTIPVRLVRARLSLPKTRFDAAAVRLMRRREIILHDYENPSSLTFEQRQTDLVRDGQVYYGGMVLPDARTGVAEAPRRRTHEDIEAALYQDKVYRKLNAQYYRAEPGSPQAAALGAKLERRRTELLANPEFKVAEPVAEAAPVVVSEGVGALAAEEDCSCKGMLAAEEGTAAEKTRILRWHRGETEGSYHAEGTLGKYTVAKRAPDRRHGVLPHLLTLNGATLSQFDTKGEAQAFAASYDSILPFVAPRGTPVEVSPEGRALIGGKSIVDACLPWVHVTRDVEKLNACKVTGKRVDGPRELYDLLVPYLSTSDQEVFLVVLLDVKNQLRGVAEVARGQRSKVVVDPVDILRPVIITGASTYYAVHCHPSGDATPSGADRKLTRAIEKASKIAAPDVNFAGHYVIVDGAYADAVSGKITKVKA